MSLSRGAAFFVAACLVVRSAGADTPPDREACAKAYEQAQRARQAHQLKAARESLLVCSRSECPGWVKKECVPWLGQVEAAMPSIVVTAHEPGGKVRTDVRVVVDGALHSVTEAISLDPGEHTIVLEAPGALRIEQQLSLREGEHDRKIDLTLTPAETKPAPPSPPEPKPGPLARGDEEEKPTPSLVYVLGGTALLAGGVGAYFQVSGMSQRSDLHACAPSCAQSDVDTARTTLWTGNILLGVSVLALAGAAVLYLTRPSVRVETSALLRGAF